MLNIGVIVYIYNNHRLFSIFTSLIERIVRVIIIFYKKGSIFITWRTPIGINYIIDIIDILYISDLFINLFLALKLKASGLYIIIKNYTI